MPHAAVDELAPVVALLVEAYDARHADRLEERRVVLGGERAHPGLDLAPPREWAREREELGAARERRPTRA